MSDDLREGVTIGVPCDVKPGPFSGEQMISIETLSGPVSGFVRDNELKQQEGQWFVRAVVEEVYADSILVRIRGSFFTTNGIAAISRNLALAA
jgi:hypothetical protein